jgi:predicted GNAT family acetyltransferase
MAGLIHTNGLESPANRGDFYAYGDLNNDIEGIALIGHAVTFESDSPDATAALARQASSNPNTVLIRGEQEKIEEFRSHFEALGRAVNVTCQEQLLELSELPRQVAPDHVLRPATTEELDQIALINAELTMAERGSNPLTLDPEGFRHRVLRRIQQAQVWVWVEREKVVFKAEVITRTPEVIYLEGIYVHPDERGKGHGRHTMKQLGHTLLRDARTLALFVNEGNKAAQALYRSAGFQIAGRYQTIYLQQPE